MVTHTSALPDLRTRLGAVSGVVGPTLFVGCFLLQNLLREDDDAVSEPVSALEAGALGWVQQANFVVFGLLVLGFAVGLHRGVGQTWPGALGSVLIGLAGLGLFLAAARPLARDASGEIYDPGGHFLSGVMFFGSTALALLALGLRFRHLPGWRDLAGFCLTAGVVAVVGFVLLGRFAIPDGSPLHEYVGLLQRAVLLLVVLPCLVAIALRLWPRPGRVRPADRRG